MNAQPAPTERRRLLAVFIDFENLALGFRGPNMRFDIARVLRRLVEKGNIVVKRAYADWKRFQNYTTDLHEAAVELIEIPRRHITGKNSADIRLVVDAMDLGYSKEHIDTIVIVSGDSDFSPLVSKLKENGKHVIGLGMQASTSELLRDNCDEFIYYEDLTAPVIAPVVPKPVAESLDEKRRKLFELLVESCEALRRENRDTLWSSMVKETMQRKRPAFNEGYYGYKTFSKLLEDAQARGLVELRRDESNRTYIVTRFGPELENGARATGRSAPAAAPAAAPHPAASAPDRIVPPPQPETTAAPEDEADDAGPRLSEAEAQAQEARKRISEDEPAAEGASGSERPRRRRGRRGGARRRGTKETAGAPAEAPAVEAPPAKEPARPRRRAPRKST